MKVFSMMAVVCLLAVWGCVMMPHVRERRWLPRAR
jgi:hypothetical protein